MSRRNHYPVLINFLLDDRTWLGKSEFSSFAKWKRYARSRGIVDYTQIDDTVINCIVTEGEYDDLVRGIKGIKDRGPN